MASQTLARISTTPTSLRTILRVSTPKSILKRPTPLPLSPIPLPFFSSFSIHLSPSVNSPHVHFPPSPSMTSTYTTHSPNTYDRAPISVSPNPLALPAWGDRVYSPSVDGFKLADPPKQVPLIMQYRSSPAVPEFEDPRSPCRRETRIRSAKLPNTPARSPVELSKALFSYLPTPYPSAPTSPVNFGPPAEVVSHGKAVGRRTLSLNDGKSTRKRRTQTHQSKPSTTYTPIPSPLRSSHLSPVEEHFADARGSKKPPALPLDMEMESAGDTDNININVISLEPSTSLTSTRSAQLSQAFWQSMSLIGTKSDLQERGEHGFEDIMTSCETPTTTASQEFEYELSPPSSDIDSLGSGVQPRFMFGTRDGALWSPGLPRNARPGTTSSKSDTRELQLGDLMSPGKQASFGLGSFGMETTKEISRSQVASPSPNEPSAAFPSFSAALAAVVESDVGPGMTRIAYPSRAHVSHLRI